MNCSPVGPPTAILPRPTHSICPGEILFTALVVTPTAEFSKTYRNADVLLIDDIQFFQGKEQTQEQFFHTFNELFQAGKQIVLTADRYPGEMVGLQDRLLSRFSSGLAVDIQPANYETRVAIIMEKAEMNGLKLPYDIIELIGSHIKNNIRDLESTIIRLLAHSSLSNQEIDYNLAKKVIKERVFFPGYILIKMKLDKVSRYFIENIQGVISFVGARGKQPTPLRDSEIKKIFCKRKIPWSTCLLL